MKLTPHFTLAEFACSDGTPYPLEWIEGRLILLCQALEVLWAAFGDRPTTITSGYRTASYNRSIGGAKRSQHVQGRAADIQKGVSPKRVQHRIRALMDEGEIPLGGLGRYRSFTHYDSRGHRVTWGPQRPGTR